MANAWMTNKGKAEAAKQDPTAVTLRALLVDTAPASEAAMQDFAAVSDVDDNEMSGTGYERVTLENVTITEDDTNNLAAIDADDISFDAIDAGTVAGIWLFRQVGASDADTDPVWCFLGCTPKVTNGGGLTLSFDDAGIYSLT